MNQERSIFQEIQQKYNILEVARNLGIKFKKIGKQVRADSIAPDGGGENALALFEDSGTWRDYKLDVSGDITDLVAIVNHGDISKKGEAIRELMPNFDNGRYEAELRKKQAFEKQIEQWHKYLLDPQCTFGQYAMKYLTERRISLQTIKELKIGVQGVSTENGGFRIVFPFWSEGGREILYFTTRRYPCHYHYENGHPVGELYDDEKVPKYKKAIHSCAMLL